VSAGAHELRLRGRSVLVDGAPVSLTVRQAAVLSALVSSEGRVLSRAELLKQAWHDELADEHAVEMTVARLRSALGPAGSVVQTVVKRGYRLAVSQP
jgi:uroporphyrinogen-III synthase